MVRVMVVEDQAIVAADLGMTLEAMGHEVVATAATGAQAIERARATRPDVLLMDIQLRGDIDGIAAGSVLRGELHVPIVFITAFADEATRRRAEDVTPAAYLLKPFDEAQIADAISRAVASS